MQTIRHRLLAVFATLALFIPIFKVFLHPSFLAVPTQYRTDISDEERKAAIDYLKDYDHPPAADDVIVPDADVAMNLAYGGSGG